MGLEVVEADFLSMPMKDGNEGDITNQELGFCEYTEFRQEDAINECPKPKKIHTFYFVKYPYYEDLKLKSKFEKAYKTYQKNKQAWVQITEALRETERNRYSMSSQLSYIPFTEMIYRSILDEKRNRIDHLHYALVKLQNIKDTSREKDVGLCSSEVELNYLIRGLHIQMQRGCNTLAQEKKLLRVIQKLERTRKRVIANTPLEEISYWKPREHHDTYKYSWKEYNRERINLKPLDFDGVRKEKQLISNKVKYLKEKVNAMDNEISALKVKTTAINNRNNASYGAFLELEKQRDEENVGYYQNLSLLNNARDLAAKSNIAALKELSRSEVEKFMSLWSSTKAFRDDYVKRISPSLDSRQLSRDGRIRKFDDKPVVSEFPSTSEFETVTKVNIKQPKEDCKTPFAT